MKDSKADPGQEGEQSSDHATNPAEVPKTYGLKTTPPRMSPPGNAPFEPK